jgi:SOS response regulatory protein OraA/RecX
VITPEIIDYIKSSMAAGLDNEAIKTELRIKGLANDEIDAAFVSAAKSQVNETAVATAPGQRQREKFL